MLPLERCSLVMGGQSLAWAPALGDSWSSVPVLGLLVPRGVGGGSRAAREAGLYGKLFKGVGTDLQGSSGNADAIAPHKAFGLALCKVSFFIFFFLFFFFFFVHTDLIF